MVFLPQQYRTRIIFFMKTVSQPAQPQLTPGSSHLAMLFFLSLRPESSIPGYPTPHVSQMAKFSRAFSAINTAPLLLYLPSLLSSASSSPPQVRGFREVRKKHCHPAHRDRHGPPSTPAARPAPTSPSASVSRAWGTETR